MYLKQQKVLLERLRTVLRKKYQIEDPKLVIEQPPDIKFGEYALPLAFELARRLKKAPRKIAEELVAELGTIDGFAGFDVAGAGYINARLERGEAVAAIADAVEVVPPTGVRSLVEHTSINPNKAAHIGHLRNAVLGDTFVRLLRAAGQRVDVQNYIDNTGVQVADVVVGLTHLERLNLEDVRSLMVSLLSSGQRIDYYCWDLYARVSQWYEAADVDPAAQEAEKKSRRQVRLEALHQLEAGGNEFAAIAELVSTAVLRRHLETMLRLDIDYDFLPRESDILQLHFWDSAFEQMKAKGVLYFETEGKNKGCWVMKRAGSEVIEEGPDGARGPDEDAKVIVRSNGTVTYVGKDIAYHLWKFGLLGKDFEYLPFFAYIDQSPEHTCWISTSKGGEAEHPHFGGATSIYNVIDSRQSDPQSNVIEALKGLGYVEEASRYTHFSYEMVALTPRCAMELGYSVSPEDQARPYIEVSGRKGFGVKADDLIDRLILASKKEVDARHPELSEEERESTATKIAVGALRYFMLKFTRNTVIAFDFREALSFEGETGPYVQYAIVRARNILRKAETSAETVLAELTRIDTTPYLAGEDGDGIWQLWLRASKLQFLVEQCIATAEPAHLAKHAFQLAQEFNNFYHRHHVLHESDAARKTFLLATAAVAERELVRALKLLGIESPEVM
ncbi:Arginyl-tRNA synthetase [Acidisarcina polymorpha]|uniref:arginine--tRNA ligase n=1 Tax=Acidisarcina polymorpha TaxID=2211140 RepID=A0A2Z5FVZ5_9BACT|nr:arginine--tRNA ligase [Acidisarcina polymorpha]AXC10586.1 Arginyl-tRNA synthetase [Acidisarcina polymorpha]